MQYSVDEILKDAISKKASDVHLTVFRPPVFRIHGHLDIIGEESLTPEMVAKFVYDILPERMKPTLEEKGEVDFSYAIPNSGRFRVNAYRQRKSLCLAIRILQPGVPNIATLGIAPCVKNLCALPRGLVLVTGPTGSGKSTTLAAMIDLMNRTRSSHIITIEDPIEYLYRHGTCIINQREVGDDTNSFANALRASLREDPDVILVGEMRDLETIATAVTASETGHLVLSTLHTTGAAQTIDRIIDVFPPSQQQQMRTQLASVLQGIFSQQLLPTADGKGRVLAQEVLLMNDAVRNIIRENKVHTLNSVMQTNIKTGMMPMDYSLAQLVSTRKLTYEEALAHCNEPEMLKRYVNTALY
jgi:twitching motility protein PilT